MLTENTRRYASYKEERTLSFSPNCFVHKNISPVINHDKKPPGKHHNGILCDP